MSVLNDSDNRPLDSIKTEEKPALNQADSKVPGKKLPPIKMTPDQLVQGIIFSEILGTPVSRRRHFGRRK